MPDRLFAALAAAFALASSVPGGVSATGVTTSSYDAPSTDSDFRRSCNQLRVSSAGTLTGRSNSNSGKESAVCTRRHESGQKQRKFTKLYEKQETKH